ncbi:MAG: hypothetical protein MUR51_10750 [Pseudomonadota bacterium]|nr:hypothetical protein [Pseudomonadota bacterium]
MHSLIKLTSAVILAVLCVVSTPAAYSDSNTVQSKSPPHMMPLEPAAELSTFDINNEQSQIPSSEVTEPRVYYGDRPQPSDSATSDVAPKPRRWLSGYGRQ